jgi:hypothetical protein
MTDTLTKNADTALVEIKEKLYERLANLRKIKHDFAHTARIDPIWEGIVGQCTNEEHFLTKLLDFIERS